MTILHEFVHLGTTANSINEGRYDFGKGFERDAFDVFIDELNANKVAMTFKEF